MEQVDDFFTSHSYFIDEMWKRLIWNFIEHIIYKYKYTPVSILNANDDVFIVFFLDIQQLSIRLNYEPVYTCD